MFEADRAWSASWSYFDRRFGLRSACDSAVPARVFSFFQAPLLPRARLPLGRDEAAACRPAV